MDSNKRLFRFINDDWLRGLGIFWLVMALVNTAATIFTFKVSTNVVLGPMLRDGEAVTFAGSNIFSLFIFFIVYGIVMYYESFSLVGGFGVTRKNFYLNVIANNVFIVLISSTIQLVLLRIDNYLISMMGYKPMVDFGVFNTNDSIALNVVKLSFVFLIFASIMNLLGILQYKFGYKLWIGVAIFTVFTSLTINPIGRFVKGFIRLFGDGNLAIGSQELIGIGFLIILIAYTVGFLLIRRINIK